MLTTGILLYFVLSVICVFAFNLMYEPKNHSVKEVLIAVTIDIYMIMLSPLMVIAAIVMWTRKERANGAGEINNKEE